MTWQQIYDPLGNMIMSTALAAIPVVVMLAALGFFHIKAHIAAGMGLIAAVLVAVFAYGMPAEMAGKAAMYGGFTGLLPIGWIVLNIIFLQQLAEKNGSFKILQDSLSGITGDRRLQLLLIAFCFGAFFEGAAGFGTPVAVTAGILIGLGSSPLAASGLSLIANTAPVAFGALGTPVITLAKVHRKAMMEIWPAILVTGVSFAIPQYLVSNFIGPELVDIIAAMTSMASLILFLRVWQPKKLWTSPTMRGKDVSAAEAKPPQPVVQHSRADLIRAWTSWVILSVFVFIWGLPDFKAWLNGLFAPKFPIEGLHNLILKVPPVVPKIHPEAAVYTLNLLSATGTGILLSAIVGALVMKYNPVEIVGNYLRTFWLVRYSLLTIVLMLALGTLTRYSGTDTTLGLAFANTGVFYPFFGTLMGWIGVAMTGSDTASNVLFGGMQKVAAEQLGLSPNLMGAANSSGGRDGQDDRRAVHRRGQHRHALVQPRRRHPALRVLPLHRIGQPGGPVRDASSLRLAVHADGRALNPEASPCKPH